MLFYKILLLYYLININCSYHLPVRLKNKYDSIKKKIMGMWKGLKGEILHLDINELEYPRGNATLRTIHMKLWNEYYECLKKRYYSMGKLKTLHPIALTVLEGTPVTLQCSICISPSDVHTIESINWYYRNTHDINAENMEVDLIENTIISANDRALTLYNVQVHQEGLYWCKMVDTLSGPYYVHVADETELTVEVRPNTAPNALHPQPPTIVPKYGLKVFSSWTSWSSCSVCDKVGIRMRYGYCTFSLLDFSLRRKRENEEMMPTSSEMSTTDDENIIENVIQQPEVILNSFEKTLLKMIENVLTVFQNKMPCRSWFTPKEIQNIPEIKNRRTEIIKQFCKVKCQRDVIFEIRDKTGRVLESANNSAGIYSTAQGIPESRPSVQRITIYRKQGKRTKFKCPGNLNADLPILWKIGMQEVNPDTIKVQSKGRIHIDSRQRIVFKNVQYSDINIYSCWQRNALAGTIRLEVSYGVSPKLNHRIMMLAGIPIIYVMLFVFWRAWRGRHRFT